MLQEKMPSSSSGTAPPTERRDDPGVVVEHDEIEVLEETAPASPAAPLAPEHRRWRSWRRGHPMVVAGVIALAALGIAVGVALAISALDDPAAAPSTGPAAEDCRPVPPGLTARPC